MKTPSNITEENLDKKQNWLMHFIGVASFCIIFAPGVSLVTSAVAIYILELFIFIFYLIVLREFPPFIDMFKQNKLVGFVFLLWLFSISFSLFYSPYDLFSSFSATGRYLQTIAHVFTFLIVWDFLTRYQPSLKLLFLFISLSTICVVIIFIIQWVLDSPKIGEQRLVYIWGLDPPLNSHIRHTGYQAVAALAFSLVFFLDSMKYRVSQVVSFILYAVLWGFVFWLGGRGAALSILITVVIISGVLRFKKTDNFSFERLTLLAIIIGFGISELASIGGWSGMSSAWDRSVRSESFDQLSSNRFTLWLSAWESVKDHLLFGLGPKGYSLMPNHIFGAHPHNVVIQFIVEWGVSGTVLFLFLLIKGFWVGLKRNILSISGNVNKYKLAAGAVITTLSIHALFDGTYYHPQPSFYLLIAFAIWLTPSYSVNSKQA